MKNKTNWAQKSLPYKIASTAVWMIVIPAVVIAGIIRGDKKPNIISRNREQ